MRSSKHAILTCLQLILTYVFSLSEDPNVKVGVIEAGEWLPDLPNINVPGEYLALRASVVVERD